MKKYFIATAMSALTKKEYTKFQKSIKYLVKKNPKDKFFSEILNIKTQSNFQVPSVATENDIKEIKKSTHFILFHLSNIQSSTLFELGIAYEANKKITIVYKSKEDLPFMLKELDKNNKKVKLIKIKNFTKEEIINVI